MNVKKDKKQRGIAITDIIAGILVLIVTISIVSGSIYYKQKSTENKNNMIIIHIMARQWEFIPSEITVRKDQNVTLIITSADVTHGFTLTGYNISIIIHPGETVQVSFIANKTGTFEYRCTVYCGEPWIGSGLGHWMMRGTLKVIEG